MAGSIYNNSSRSNYPFPHLCCNLLFATLTSSNRKTPKFKTLDLSMAINNNSNTNITTTTNNDAALRACLVLLAVLMAVIGIWTQSWRKVFVTYVAGMIGISGVLLPDWDFFARDYSRWCSPMTEEEKAELALRSGFRKRIPPLRLAVYSVAYGYGLYKWWSYVSN